MKVRQMNCLDIRARIVVWIIDCGDSGISVKLIIKNEFICLKYKLHLKLLFVDKYFIATVSL